MVYKWQVQVKLGRAARTDAGVHAAGNVVSMKLITVIPGVPDLVARINEELPPEIRLWSIVSASPMTDHVLNADIFPAPRAKFVQRTNVCRFSVSQHVHALTHLCGKPTEHATVANTRTFSPLTS